MKLTLERAALLKSLGHVQSVVERRNTIPILSNILIQANGDGIAFVATDMEIEIDEAVAGKIVSKGAITAPAHIFYEIVRKLPEGAQVELDATSGTQMTLSAGRSKFKLGCLPVNDFPKMPDGDFKHSFALAANDLKTMIDRTRFAISTEETRFYLNGIYMHVVTADNVSTLRTVATDGHRLARVEMAMPQKAKGLPGVIIPRKTVNEVRRLLDDATGDVKLSVSENKIRFEMNGVVITSKLIDGTFPDYERVIPSNNTKIVDAQTVAFAAAVDRVATIASEKSRGVKLTLTNGQLVLSASSTEAGSAAEELEVSYDGSPMDIGFNARYLLDILQQIEGEGVRFALSDSTAPAIISDAADLSALYVLMPMRV